MNPTRPCPRLTSGSVPTHNSIVGGLEVFHRPSQVIPSFLAKRQSASPQLACAISPCVCLSTSVHADDLPSQTWHPVTPVQDAFVVNIGDMMERWTNEKYTSTLHRVMSPVSDRNRYSVAFFNEGRLDQAVECIPTCLGPGETAKFEPVVVEAHLKHRYGTSY